MFHDVKGNQWLTRKPESSPQIVPVNVDNFVVNGVKTSLCDTDQRGRGGDLFYSQDFSEDRSRQRPQQRLQLCQQTRINQRKWDFSLCHIHKTCCQSLLGSGHLDECLSVLIRHWVDDCCCVGFALLSIKTFVALNCTLLVEGLDGLLLSQI